LVKADDNGGASDEGPHLQAVAMGGTAMMLD
jgi:hypothetical protein